jgi:tetratricopeptide (TPR) repeat protein
MLRLLTVVFAVALCTFAQPTTPADVSPKAEFPPQDRALAFSVTEGFWKTRAAELLRTDPASLDTVRALARSQDVPGILTSLRVIVDRHPERIADAFELLQDGPILGIRGDTTAAAAHQETLRTILSDAHAKAASLPREVQARAERMLLRMDGSIAPDRRDWSDRIREFVEQYRGTEAALQAQQTLIAQAHRSRQMFDELDRFIERHPGTVAAARALYTKGFHLHSITTLGDLFPRDADPIERFRLVQQVVRELQSGKYPPSEWVSKAPSLIQGFFVSETMQMAPESLDEMIGAFEAFAARQLAVSNTLDADDGIDYVITAKIGNLYARRGQRVAGVERTLDALERTVGDRSGLRLLRGFFYLHAVDEETPAQRSARLEKARHTLRSLASEGSSLNHRRALAALAALDFEEGRYAEALAAFRQYAEAYPSTSWTWVARLRVGQCQEAQGNTGAAVQAYLDAARAHQNMPMARVLGAAHAARLFELSGDLPEALEQYRHALEGWDTAYGLRYTTYVRRSPVPGDPFVTTTDSGMVQKETLAPRIAQLERSAQMPGGATLEAARALMTRERFDAAARELEGMLAEHPKSALAGEARTLLHRAHVEAALQLADVERPDRDEDRAVTIVERIAREPHDFGVTAAKIVRATLLLRRGEQAAAEAALGAALTEWHERQPLKPAANALEEDVAAIRRAVFLPRGGAIYKDGRWNAFSWPSAPPPFLLLNADLSVTDHTGEVVRLTLAQPIPEAGKVLFLDGDQIALLERIILKLGGTKRREPRHIMETPNQPVGDAAQIIALWNKFFPARPGHWGGWELESYPQVTQIRFSDAERTKAAAAVTIGYSGATVELEKEGGKWIPRRLTDYWIT